MAKTPKKARRKSPAQKASETRARNLEKKQIAERVARFSNTKIPEPGQWVKIGNADGEEFWGIAVHPVGAMLLLIRWHPEMHSTEVQYAPLANVIGFGAKVPYK